MKLGFDMDPAVVNSIILAVLFLLTVAMLTRSPLRFNASKNKVDIELNLDHSQESIGELNQTQGNTKAVFLKKLEPPPSVAETMQDH